MSIIMEWGPISSASLLGMVLSLLTSVGLPLLLLVLVYKKARAKMSSFFIGCGVFVVFALVLEQMMHAAVLAATGTLLTSSTILYGLYGGLAAALFEETGRLVAMKFLMKKTLNRQNALMYGVGHGGIEAIIIVGLAYINNLVTSVMINSGAIQISVSTLDESMQHATFEQLSALWELPAWQFYMAGVERTLAITLHIALSILVYKAVKTGQKRFWLLAFVLHFAVDFLTVTISGFGAPVWLVEVFLLVVVVLIARYTCRQYREDAVQPTNEAEMASET